MNTNIKIKAHRRRQEPKIRSISGNKLKQNCYGWDYSYYQIFISASGSKSWRYCGCGDTCVHGSFIYSRVIK